MKVKVLRSYWDSDLDKQVEKDEILDVEPITRVHLLVRRGLVDVVSNPDIEIKPKRTRRKKESA